MNVKFCATGDSLLDLPMLLEANRAWIPRHAEEIVDAVSNKPTCFVTNHLGVAGAEEILTEVREFVLDR
jgi:hypothetical protein